MVPNHSHKQDIDADDLAKLKVLLLDLEKEFDAIQLTEHSTTSASYSNSNDRKSGPNGDSLTRSGSFIYDLFQSVHIDSSNATLVISLVEQTVDLLMEDTSLGRRKCALSTLQKMLVGIFREGFSPATLAQHYRTHIHMTRPAGNPAFGAPGKQAVRTLSWWCFNAGIAMNELSRLMPRCMLLTSGTLSPLDSFAFELQTPFPIRLENPHIIQASQVWVGVVSTGPGGGALNGSYAGRTSTSYQSELGNTIVNFARLVPDGLLVFFPSYNWLQQCLDAWGWTEFSAEEERRKAQRERLQKAKATGADENSVRSRVSHEQLDARDLMTLDASNGNVSTSSASSVLNRIFAFKHVVVEPRTSAELNDTLGDYRQKLDDPQKQGAVLFAVARGKVAEVRAF
jgi:regulator of telomere elongation helicase 1